MARALRRTEITTLIAVVGFSVLATLSCTNADGESRPRRSAVDQGNEAGTVGAEDGSSGGSSNLEAGNGDINRSTKPDCFTKADSFADYLQSNRSCATDGDCHFIVPSILLCMLPELEGGSAECPGYFAVNSSVDSSTVGSREAELDQCLISGGGILSSSQTINGKYCRLCVDAPNVTCRNAQCEIVVVAP